MRLQLMQQLQQMFPAQITICGRGGRTRKWLRLKNGGKVSVRVLLQVRNKTIPAWQLRPVRGESRWTALAVLMNGDNTQFERFLVFRCLRDGGAYIRADSSWLKKGARLEKFQMFCEVLRVVRSARKRD